MNFKKLDESLYTINYLKNKMIPFKIVPKTIKCLRISFSFMKMFINDRILMKELKTQINGKCKDFK